MLLQKGKVSAVADLGGSILTGIDGNPLAVIAKQLHIPLHVIDEANVPLYQDDGQQAHTLLDQEVSSLDISLSMQCLASVICSVWFLPTCVLATCMLL